METEYLIRVDSCSLLAEYIYMTKSGQCVSRCEEEEETLQKTRKSFMRLLVLRRTRDTQRFIFKCQPQLRADGSENHSRRRSLLVVNTRLSVCEGNKFRQEAGGRGKGTSE